MFFHFLGNVKVSINGGPFYTVPPEAFDYNGYNGLTDSQSGYGIQMSWTGNSGWKTSSFSLSSVGVTSGVPFRIQFEFSTDGCSPGYGGW